MAADVVRTLREQLSEKVVITDPDILAGYRHDRAMFCESGMPLAVVLARSTADVQGAMRIAASFDIPVVPQGARSGLSGAANAIEGSLVISTEHMTKVLELDAINRFVVVQPGILNADLSRHVEQFGLFYPPDPSSWEFCTIGGNIATNSGGLCCVKYGVTADYVMALEVVLASGEILRTGRRTVKGVAGYDLARLFVGSEGTLGIITEATLALRPAAETPRTAAALFPSAQAAADAVVEIVGARYTPSLLEIMDGASLRASNALLRADLPESAGGMLLWQSDRGDASAREEIAGIAQLARAHGGEVIIADDPQEADLLMAARRVVLMAFEALGTTLVDDVCVPRTRLAELITGVERIAAEQGLRIGVVGHAGDGNMHPTVVFDSADADQAARARISYGLVMDLGLALGGTITGEHGVGLLKRDWLLKELDPVAARLHRELKAMLDPRSLLNPGKVFPL